MIFWLWVAVYLMPSAPFVKAAFAQYAQARAEYGTVIYWERV